MSVVVDLTIEMKDGSIGAQKFGAFDAETGFDMVDDMVRAANFDGQVLRHRVSVIQDHDQTYVPRILQQDLPKPVRI